MLSKKKVGECTYLLNYLMLNFNILKWLRLWKQMTEISAVHNCCCWRCCRFFPGWRNTNKFPLIFIGFPDSVGTKLCQKIRIQEQFKNQSEKVTFVSINQVAKKKFGTIQGIQRIQELTVMLMIKSVIIQYFHDLQNDDYIVQ